MPRKVTMREVKRLIALDPLEKPSRRARNLEDLLINGQQYDLVFSKNAEETLKRIIAGLKKEAEFENVPQGNI